MPSPYMTRPANRQHDWLHEPQTTYFHDERGGVEAAYIQLRTGSTFRVVRPNPEFLVFLYLGCDDIPVGISMLEPVSGAVQTQIIYRLLASPDGTALGVGCEVHNTFVPEKAPVGDFLGSTLSQFRAANDRLQGSAA